MDEKSFAQGFKEGIDWAIENRAKRKSGGFDG